MESIKCSLRIETRHMHNQRHYEIINYTQLRVWVRLFLNTTVLNGTIPWYTYCWWCSLVVQ